MRASPRCRRSWKHLRAASGRSITELRASLQTVTSMQKDKKIKLWGLKNMEPSSFDGRKDGVQGVGEVSEGVL